MFEITDETRSAAIDAMRQILEGHTEPSDAVLNEAFDAAVEIVKKQFGF